LHTLHSAVFETTVERFRLRLRLKKSSRSSQIALRRLPDGRGRSLFQRSIWGRGSQLSGGAGFAGLRCRTVATANETTYSQLGIRYFGEPHETDSGSFAREFVWRFQTCVSGSCPPAAAKPPVKRIRQWSKVTARELMHSVPPSFSTDGAGDKVARCGPTARHHRRGWVRQAVGSDFWASSRCSAVMERREA